METLSKLIDLVQKPWIFKTALVLFLGWLLLNIVCWIFGAVGLYTIGRRKGLKPYLPAFLPGGQVWYTLHLAEKDRLAKRAELLLWWCPTLVAVAGMAVLWAAVQYLDGGGMVLVLLGLAVALLVVALVLYIWLRGLEFRGLSRIFKNQTAWTISLVGTVLGVPVQRLLLFVGRFGYMK
ncbi:MAG: hypothetical protein IJ043_10720 [Clostridia bacterium]|nr:hypothetical protein [Clostridia bacterium]